MAFKREWVDEWLATMAPGEQPVSFMVAATGSLEVDSIGQGLKSTAEYSIEAQVANLALADETRVGVGIGTVFYALTDRQLMLGSRSAMRNRPKLLLHAAPADGATVYWLDHDEGAGNRFRHLLVTFGDGHWRSDRSGLTALGRDMTRTSNVHEFFTALGERAIDLTQQSH